MKHLPKSYWFRKYIPKIKLLTISKKLLRVQTKMTKPIQRKRNWFCKTSHHNQVPLCLKLTTRRKIIRWTLIDKMSLQALWLVKSRLWPQNRDHNRRKEKEEIRVVSRPRLIRMRVFSVRKTVEGVFLEVKFKVLPKMASQEAVMTLAAPTCSSTVKIIPWVINFFRVTLWVNWCS